MRSLIFPTMFSRASHFTNLRRAVVTLAMLGLPISATALAQYGGGGTSPSYRSKGEVVGGAVGQPPPALGCFIGSSTIGPSCKAAWLAVVTSWSTRRTTKAYNLTNKQHET